jgi:hypothetical protein
MTNRRWVFLPDRARVRARRFERINPTHSNDDALGGQREHLYNTRQTLGLRGPTIRPRRHEGPPVRRRAGKDRVSFEERLAGEAHRYEAEAKELPLGAKRDDLVRRAREAKTTTQMSRWLALARLTPTEQ